MLATDAYFAIRQELMALEYSLARTESDRLAHRLDIDELLLRWRRFATDPGFASDDRTLLQDYVICLFARNTLERFVVAASEQTRAFLKPLIEPSDDAFRAQTSPTDPGLTELYKGSSEGWWWRVTPRSLGNELRRQLTDSGTIDGEGRVTLRDAD